MCTMAPKVKKAEKPTKNVPVEPRGKEPPFAAPEGWEWHKVAKVGAWKTGASTVEEYGASTVEASWWLQRQYN